MNACKTVSWPSQNEKHRHTLGTAEVFGRLLCLSGSGFLRFNVRAFGVSRSGLGQTAGLAAFALYHPSTRSLELQ
jgi:hypothetical protein